MTLPVESSETKAPRARDFFQNQKDKLHKTFTKLFSRQRQIHDSLSQQAKDDSVKELLENDLEKPKSYFQILAEQPPISLDEMFGFEEDENKSFGVTAELVANNSMSKETEEQLKSLKLDGNLIGIGTASIFTMLEAFKDCKSFTSIDIHPSPVALGRMLSRLLIEQESFEAVLAELGNETNSRTLLTELGLPVKYLESVIKSISMARNLYTEAQDPRSIFVKKDGLHVRQGDLRNLMPLEAIKLHFNQLKKLAKSGNLNFVQTNFFNPGFWTNVQKNEPAMAQENNLVFLSNGLDHVFRSKTRLWDQWTRMGKTHFVKDEQTVISDIVHYNFKDWSKSTFDFTLTTLDYKLRLSDTPPIFAFDENEGLVLKETA